MRLIRGLYNCPKQLFSQGSVATIGNFDGVHLGHQAIIKKLTAKAIDLSLPSVVVLFEPHAQEFFRPEQAPARLYKLTGKIMALKKLGVDYVLCLRFADELANLSAQDFVRRVLNQHLNIKHLFIGDDFRFGHKRQGDFELLKSYDFAVEANQSVTIELDDSEVRISSSLVRDLIEQGQFALTSKVLGKNYRIHGKVAHGDKQGRQIGVPTANIALKRRKSPLKGVYAVKVYMANEADGNDGDVLNGVANIGRKPTLKDSSERLEVHLLDFDKDIYGRRISVEPIAKIRDEQKFESIEALKKQIQHDIKTAQAIFEQ
ncbi:MAG: bifunctional riboflavin kinase/FAD synthetase [Gammaproteobacteria bacterium]|nr:bifunctional riboflavin kinase/FAD synthetase [Gammaproteobacteria bacterium]